MESISTVTQPFFFIFIFCRQLITNLFLFFYFHRYESLQPTGVDPVPQVPRPLGDCVVTRRAAVRHGLRRHPL